LLITIDAVAKKARVFVNVSLIPAFRSPVVHYSKQSLQLLAAT
jgi:hypothetical protein